MHRAFRIYEEASPELIDFLSGTTLGSNGAQYQHLNTKERIHEIENPLHVSLIRDEKIIGNISFARRDKNWYVRYFAFDKLLQSKGQNSTGKKKKSILKEDLKQFFLEKLKLGETECFYAYIDPKNDKSLLAAESLGFQKSDQLYTQTFSRLFPKTSPRLFEMDEKRSIPFIKAKFSSEQFYHQTNAPGKSYCLKNSAGEIIAFAKASPLSWLLHRLPGKFGKTLVTILPYVPILSSFINPKRFNFLGLDHVWVKNNDSAILTELFSGILKNEKQRIIIWWTDKRVLRHSKVARWGIMHALLKTSPVDVYTLSNTLENSTFNHFAIVKDFS